MFRKIQTHIVLEHAIRLVPILPGNVIGVRVERRAESVIHTPRGQLYSWHLASIH